MSSKPQRNKGSKHKNRKASLISSPNINREPKISFQQRINPAYLQEESQVQKLIEGRQINESTQSDLEVQFFTESITTKNLDLPEHDGSNSSLKSLQSTEFQTDQPNFLNSIVQIEEDKLFERVKEESASNPEILYYPSTEKPSIPNDDAQVIPTLLSQGIHEPSIPKNIKQRNKNLLYNRLLEENKKDLFNIHGELIGLQDHHPHQQQLMKYESEKEFPVKFILFDEEQLNTADHQLEESSVLVIKIGRLQFNHHHMFSEEEFLAKSIEKLYHEYSSAKKSGTSEKLVQRIAFQKNAITGLPKDSEEYKKALTEILDLRNKFHLEKKTCNDRVQTILQEYKALKALRKTKQFNSTTLKLIIKVEKDTTGSRDESRILEDMLEEEVQETFELEFIEYLDKKRDRKQRRKSLSPEELENLPVIPPKPNLEKIKSKVRKKFKDCHFDLSGQSNVDILMCKIPKSQSHNNTLEKKRISGITGLKFHLKVFCNNESIGVISQISISEDFEINFNSSISLRLTNRLPDQIRVDLVEQRPLKPKLKITKISIPVPRLHQGSIDDSCGYSYLEFTSPKSVQSDVGIGSGQFCIRKNHQQMISGTLAIKIGWKETRDHHIMSPPVQRIPRLMSEDSQFDPMNPDLGGPATSRDTRTHDKDTEDEQEDAEEEFYFNEEELAFCSLEEFENNPRNRILSERAKNNVKYRDYKLVPYNERQLEDTDTPMKVLDETLGMDPIDLQRYKGKKYLMDVYSRISNYCRSLNDEYDENQLLMENMPTLASMVTRFFQLFGPNRPLKPVRRAPGGSHRLSSRNIDVSQFKVSLNIVRAFGVPHRQDDTQMNTRKSSNMSSPKEPGYRPINIRPFVTASFKDVSVRTSTGDGSNPTWNEQMTIPLNLKNWSDLKGYLNIQLFDEYVDDILEDDRNRLTDIYQRISSRFIAELRIPLTDLYFSQRIEGTFEMNSPPLLGYTKSQLKTPQSQTGISTAFVNNSFIPDLKGPVYLSFLINLEPFFEHEFFTTTHLECTEPDQMKTTIGMWMYDYVNEFPHRRMDPFVTLLNGKRVCIMNLLGSINLPFPLSEDKEKMESLLRRYVSLIPTLQTIDPCVELTGVWLRNEVFNTLRCSQKDLAVLLTNFYLSLGLDAWLMIGESQLRVNSSFVLLKESDTDYFIIDPVTGRKYQHTDTYCPLTSIHFLINDKNLWGNIQAEKKVFMTKYDVKDTSEWRAVFKKTHEISRGSLQDANYVFTASYDIRNIHAIIESKLTKKISQWRGHRKTIWNRIVKDNLRRILIELERDAADSAQENGDHLEKLNFLHNNYKISGCPLNMSYINLSHIVERVKSTGIHLNTDPRAEFGLSVYVHPYPNFVISVWVFLIALLPK